MRWGSAQATARLRAASHGILATIHPQRGPDLLPVVYVTCEEHLTIPIDKVKSKSTDKLQRETNLTRDPRAALLVEQWDDADWSRLWWVRADLVYLVDPSPAIVDALTERLAAAVPQYGSKPFHRILVFRVTRVSGWAADEATPTD